MTLLSESHWIPEVRFTTHLLPPTLANFVGSVLSHSLNIPLDSFPAPFHYTFMYLHFYISFGKGLIHKHSLVLEAQFGKWLKGSMMPSCRVPPLRACTGYDNLFSVHIFFLYFTPSRSTPTISRLDYIVRNRGG